MQLVPVTSTSDVSTVTATSAQFTPTLAADAWYLFVASVACFILQAADPTATAADGSMYVPAGVVVPVFGGNGAKLAVIRAAGDGSASLTRAMRF